MSTAAGPGTVHIIGAGLAGLAAAVRLISAGCPVIIYEMAGHAGGRCRSFDDTTLGRRIDNGNHLMLSGNSQVLDYLDIIGASQTLWQPRRAAFPFVDLLSGQRWTIRPGRGRFPLWLLDQSRRTPGSTAFEHLSALKLAWAPASATVADCFDTNSALYKRFWQPLAVAVLNTDPQEAAASLLWPVLQQTVGRGEAACRACIPEQGLSESLIDPAVTHIRDNGSDVRFRQRLRSLEIEGSRVVGLVLDDDPVKLKADDAVILAVPPDVAASLIPGIEVPNQHNTIINGHFLLPQAVPEPGFTGLINGHGQWLFVRRDIASMTISAATELAERDTQEIADLLWPEICRAMKLANLPLPGYRIVKERRATITQTPDQEALRPATKTFCHNLLLAGDWTATALPATIEGAVMSGHKAATAYLQNQT